MAIISTSADVDRQIRAREQQRGRALVAGDTSALRGIFDPELVVTHSRGLREEGVDVLDALDDGRLRYTRYETDITRIVARSDHAVVTGELRATLALAGGAEHPIHALSTNVWSHGDEGWRLLAAHTTAVADATRTPAA